MRIKSFIFALFTINLLAAATIITLLFNTKPNATDIIIIFYLCALVFIAITYFLIRLFFIYMKENGLPSWSKITNVLRFGFVISFYLTLALFFQSTGLLNSAVMIALAISAIFTEILLKRKFSKIK